MLLQFPLMLHNRPLQHRTVPYKPHVISAVSSNVSANNPQLKIIFRKGVEGDGNAVPNVKITYERSTGTGTTPFWNTVEPVVGQVTYIDPYVGNTSYYKARGTSTNASGSDVTAIVAVPGTAAIGSKPSRPEDLTAIWNGSAISVNCYDTAANEGSPGFQLERSDDGGAFALIYTWPRRSGIGYMGAAYSDTAVSVGHVYQYRVRSISTGATYVSDWKGPVSVVIPVSTAQEWSSTLQAIFEA